MCGIAGILRLTDSAFVDFDVWVEGAQPLGEQLALPGLPARCSGIRFSFQCSTASAVSITGLLAMRRISGRLSTASINPRACRLARSGSSAINAADHRFRNVRTVSGSSGPIRAW